MRKFWIGGNWKMNGSLETIESLLKEMMTHTLDFSKAEVVIFPSFVYISAIKKWLQESAILFGAQTLSEHEKGAYTGEISGTMLKELGCVYVLTGHSERRHLYQESPECVAQKFEQALKCGLKPVLCLGETQQERESNQTEVVVKTQLQAVIDRVGIESFEEAVIAYEPVWAIGTGLTATPEQAQAVHQFIRAQIAQHSEKMAEGIRIVYGGSVKGDNAATLFKMPDIDGGLVGGASLKAAEFMTICAAPLK